MTAILLLLPTIRSPPTRHPGRGFEDGLEEIEQRFNYEALDGQAREVQHVRQCCRKQAGTS